MPIVITGQAWREIRPFLGDLYVPLLIPPARPGEPETVLHQPTRYLSIISSQAHYRDSPRNSVPLCNELRPCWSPTEPRKWHSWLDWLLILGAVPRAAIICQHGRPYQQMRTCCPAYALHPLIIFPFSRDVQPSPPSSRDCRMGI